MVHPLCCIICSSHATKVHVYSLHTWHLSASSLTMAPLPRWQAIAIGLPQLSSFSTYAHTCPHCASQGTQVSLIDYHCIAIVASTPPRMHILPFIQHLLSFFLSFFSFFLSLISFTLFVCLFVCLLYVFGSCFLHMFTIQFIAFASSFYYLLFFSTFVS